MTHHVVTLIGGSSLIKFALFEAAGLGGPKGYRSFVGEELAGVEAEEGEDLPTRRQCRQPSRRVSVVSVDQRGASTLGRLDELNSRRSSNRDLASDLDH